ncbi:MAG: hypothetical protein ACREAF_00710 [Nitrosopumilaceae archaeon]
MNLSRNTKGIIIAIIIVIAVVSFSGFLGWYAISKTPTDSTEPSSINSNISQNQEQPSDFEIRKQFVLDNLVQIQKNDFKIEFDKDLTSKQKDGAIFHSYKIIHKTDGWIGDLTFYYGKSDVFHPSIFDNIFQTSIFLSNENGVIQTTHSLPIVKNALFVLIPVWSYTGVEENSSKWIDNVIENSPVDENSEQSGTISLDDKEIRFDYREKELGYYRLLITDKID